MDFTFKAETLVTSCVRHLFCYCNVSESTNSYSCWLDRCYHEIFIRERKNSETATGQDFQKMWMLDFVHSTWTSIICEFICLFSFLFKVNVISWRHIPTLAPVLSMAAQLHYLLLQLFSQKALIDQASKSNYNDYIVCLKPITRAEVQ